MNKAWSHDCAADSIERHRDGAQQQAALTGDAEAVAVEFDRIIVSQRDQTLNLRGARLPGQTLPPDDVVCQHHQPSAPGDRDGQRVLWCFCANSSIRIEGRTLELLNVPQLRHLVRNLLLPVDPAAARQRAAH
jgi:hypothetical protein